MVDSLEARRLLSGVYFRAPVTLNSPFTDAAIAADFNRDGRADMAGLGSVGGLGGVVVLLGNGDGTFQPPVLTPLDLQPGVPSGKVVTGDFNGDAIPDLAVGTPDSGLGSTRVLLGQGNGAFESTSESVPGFNHKFDVVDIDGDGILDLFPAAASGPIPAALRGGGDLTFSVLQLPDAFAPGSDVLFGGVVDVNADGTPDVVRSTFTNPDSQQIEVLLNQGGGRFTQARVIATDSGVRPATMWHGDFDGDGAVDLVVRQSDSGLAVLRGLRSGAFAPMLTLDVPADPDSTDRMVVGDFDGDGYSDLARCEDPAGEDPWGEIDFRFGTPEGAFDLVSLSLSRSPVRLLAADFNGDGRTDIAGDDGRAGISLLLSSNSFADVATARFGDMDGTRLPSVSSFFTRSNGAVFRIKGPGTGYVLNNGKSGAQLVLDGSTDRTSIRITPFGLGWLSNTLDGFTVNGSIGSIAGLGECTIGGRCSVSGSARTIHAFSMGDCRLEVSGSLKSLQAFYFVNTSVSAGGPIGHVVCREWSKGYGNAPSLSAPSFVHIATRSMNVLPPGDFEGDVFATDAGGAGIGAFTVGGKLWGSRIRSAAGIGPVTLGAVEASTVFAGVGGTNSSLPQSRADFGPRSWIGAIRVGGLEGQRFDVANSQFAAATIGKVRFGRVKTANAATPFGLSAVVIVSYARASSGGVRFELVVPGVFDQEEDFVAQIVS